MRRIAVAAALMLSVPALGATVACSSTWLQNFQNNPVEQIQVFESGVHTALASAQVAWSFVQPFLPAASAAAITQQYENAVFAVTHALTVLDDGVTAALAAQQTNPDFTALTAAVTNAVAQVIAIIDQYKGVVPPDGGVIAVPDAGSSAPGSAAVVTLPGLEDARTRLTALKQMAHH